jgi:predicted nucleic acid-binding protein
VKVIVDANIVFSGILNSNSKIADILINSNERLIFIAPNFLRTEINKYHSKISKISGMTIEEVQESEFQICKKINFISEEQIAQSAWEFAEKLVSDVDPKDTPYIAFSKHFDCSIWSGDKKLVLGLAKKGFLKFISIDDLLNWRDSIGPL